MSTQNPIIGGLPGDTFNNATDVLCFLSNLRIPEDCGFTKKENLGLQLILDSVRQAIDYESKRMEKRS